MDRSECAAALVGGVNLLLAPGTAVKISALGALSAVGRCQALDAAADGYGRGEGAAALFLERVSGLEVGVATAVVGTAVNSSGRGSGVTAPSGPAQRRLIGRALAAAGARPEAVAAVSLHGTGPALGDPIEVNALLAALSEKGSERTAVPRLALTASKTAFGHTEGAAGLTGLLHAAGDAQARRWAPVVNLGRLNPYVAQCLDTAARGCFVPRQSAPWVGTAPLAGGMGGGGEEMCVCVSEA